jgi:hypothetical protein
MKKLFALAAIAAATLAPAHALTTGDIAFTAFNADEDGYALVTFVNIAANSQIFFTDNEWNGSAFNTGESYHAWSTGANVIAAGTVVRFSRIDSSTLLSASLGTFSRTTVASSNNYGSSQDEESIYVYLAASASAAPQTFLAAITSTAFGTASAGTLTNTGLAIGAGAVALGGGAEFDEYTGLRGGLTSFAAYKPLVSDIANWTNNAVNGTYAATVPNTTAFAITPIPEPGTYALLLAGLGVVGFVARRRRG